ncbi:MAG: hypothetical protein LBE05_05645 [Microbacterium sp.]|jgi:hypothetical protein|nr:hypothetical protein [Microbacterium sp.]
MAQTRKFVSLSALAVLVCAPLLVGAAVDPSSAAPNGDEAAVAESVRVIDRSDQTLYTEETRGLPAEEAMRESAGSAAKMLAVDEAPAVGETVKIVYSDVVVVNQRLAAGCSVSADAAVPYRVGMTVYSYSHYKQTGCSGIQSTSGTLQKYEPWFSWNTKGEDKKNSPASGTQYSFVTTFTCSNSNNTLYRTTQFHMKGGIDYDVAMSNEITLACGN